MDSLPDSLKSSVWKSPPWPGVTAGSHQAATSSHGKAHVPTAPCTRTRGDCGSSGLNLGMGGEEVGLCSPAAFLGFSLQKWGPHLHESQPGGSPEDGKNTAGFPGIPSLGVLQDNILAREL